MPPVGCRSACRCILERLRITGKRKCDTLCSIAETGSWWPVRREFIYDKTQYTKFPERNSVRVFGSCDMRVWLAEVDQA
jgi:hypothetical protein